MERIVRIFALLSALVAAAPAIAEDARLARDKNTISDGASQFLMMRGKDPVSYFMQPAPVDGSRDLTAEHEGATYRFATEDNRRLFLAAPDKYAPQYGGHCSNGMAYAIGGSKGETHRIIDGKLYLFGGERSRAYFEMDLAANRQRADRYWAAEYRGNDWREVSSKRSSWGGRVDHYKTNRELAAEYERYQAGRK